MAVTQAFNKSQNTDYYNDLLSRELIETIGVDGFAVSQQTTDNITELSTTMPNGTMWYDTDTNTMQVLINGTVKTITTS